MQRKIFFLSLLIIFSCRFLLAQNQLLSDKNFEPFIMKGVHYTYNMQFDSAEVVYRDIIKKYPNHPVGYFLMVLNIWWQMKRDEINIQYDARFRSYMDSTFDICDRLYDKNKNDVEAIFFETAAVGFMGRFLSNRDEWLESARYGLVGYRNIQKDVGAYENEFLLPWGAYNYYAVIVPEKYPVIRPMMIFFGKPDKKAGLRMLEDAYEKAFYTKYEALYFLIDIYTQFERDYKQGLYYSEIAHGLFPDNTYFHLRLAKNTYLNGKSQEAEKIFLTINQRAEDRYGAYAVAELREACYWLGIIHQRKKNYKGAIAFYNISVRNSEFLNYPKDEFLYHTKMLRANCNDAMGERTKAVLEYREIANQNFNTAMRNKALMYLKTPYVPKR